MKNVFLLALLYVFCAPLFGQIQVGLVREQNSGNRPIGGVQINFEHAVPTTSADKDGSFRLVFKGLKPGYPIFKQEIFKHGFELVNEREIESLKISNDNKLGVDIIMAPNGSIAAAKARYHNIAVRELTAGLEREKEALKVKLEREEMKSEAYFAQLEKLQKDFDRQQKELDPLASQFARVNFDDVDSVYQQALQLFKTGKVDEAIATLENADPVSQIGKVIAQQQKNIKDEQELEIRKKQTLKIKQEVIAKAKLLADMYSMQFNPKKAEILYDTLLRLDSTDLEILTNASKFYRGSHRYEKAKRVLSLIISHPNSEQWEVADALRFIGDMHTITGNLPDALKVFEECEKIYEELWQSDTTSSLFKRGLATSYQWLGNTYILLGNLEKAQALFQKMVQLFEELYIANPQNTSFKNDLAISYSKLGDTQTELGNILFALTLFEKMSDLFEELCVAHPQRVEFKNGLAVSSERLGDTNKALGNLSESLIFFEKMSRLFEELLATHPQNVDFKNGLAVSKLKLGQIQTYLGDLSKALNFYENYNQLEKELHEAYPQNVEFKKNCALSYGQLGWIHTFLGNLSKALSFYECYNQLEKELHEAYPQNVEFKRGLAISYESLGVTQQAMGNLHRALDGFSITNRMFEELCEAYPYNVQFKNRLGISCHMLGNTYLAMGDFSAALAFFEKFNHIEKELHKAYPQNVDFKNGLAYSYLRLGDFYFYSQKQNSPSQALLHYQKADTLWTELVRDAPENSEYQKQLAEVRGKLAELGQNMPETMPQSQQREKAEAAVTSFTLTQETSLRAAPASDARIFRRFKPGDQVRLLEKTDEWWWKVAFGGVKGYVKAALLKEMENR